MLEVAKKAAIEAGDLAIKTRTKGLSTSSHNSETNITTEGDLLAEKKIVEIVSDYYPKHNIVSEETERRNNNSEYSWIISNRRNPCLLFWVGYIWDISRYF